MDQEELENLRDDYGYFELGHLCWGNLTIKICQPYISQMEIEFDEVIGDCVPGMVQMYNALKHRKPYDFYSAAGDGYYVFEIRDFAKDGDEEFVFFSIAAGKGDIWEGELRHRTEICSDVPVNYLLYEFEIFFRTLLHHPDFPFQFPGFICMDDKQSNEASAQADEIFKRVELTDDEYLELEKKCIREHVTKFDDIGEELIKKYKKCSQNIKCRMAGSFSEDPGKRQIIPFEIENHWLAVTIRFSRLPKCLSRAGVLFVGQVLLELSDADWKNVMRCPLYTDILDKKGSLKGGKNMSQHADMDRLQKAKQLQAQNKEEEAFSIFRELAEHENAEAQCVLGEAFEKCAEEYRADIYEAEKWYQKAAEQGYAEAQYLLGHCFEFDEDNAVQAEKWYRRAAKQGHVEAQYRLGIVYELGEEFAERIEEDEEEAAEWYRKAAEQGHAEAQNALGNCYAWGEGVERDEEEAVKWWEKAAEQGCEEARHRLGDVSELDEKLTEPIDENGEKLTKWYRKTDEQRHAEVLNALGKKVERNEAEAVKWWEKEADRGDRFAQYELGLYYSDGAENDLDKAREWLEKAAGQGLVHAQYNLGFSYEHGEGAKRDKEKAFAWYLKAAEQGHDKAQYNVGKCYYYGRGVEENQEKARIWWQKAAGQGNEEAQEALDSLIES